MLRDCDRLTEQMTGEGGVEGQEGQGAYAHIGATSTQKLHVHVSSSLCSIFLVLIFILIVLVIQRGRENIKRQKENHCPKREKEVIY